jgi:enolase
MICIQHLSALEILDSRGRPTVRATCTLASGATASASVPSGASTGAGEAIELRDGDPARYSGLGCRKAVANIEGEILSALKGVTLADQWELDDRLVALDGTDNKSRLGANALLAVSIAFARATAVQQNLPLYAYFASLVDATPRLPRLTVNLFSGGKHAGGQVAIQDVLVVPLRAQTIDQSLADVYAVYQAAAKLTSERYQMRLLRADEGGLAPPFATTEDAFAGAVDAMQRAGLAPGTDMALAIDVASSHFFDNGRYHIDGESLDSPGMIARLTSWLERYPIISIEDGLSEDDWDHWPAWRRAANGRCLVLGDDFLCTNPARIRRAADTLAADAYRIARSNAWSITVSARSGETEDDWLADLATGWAADQIKIGSITQSERLAKYNRLLEIERTAELPMAGWTSQREPA